MLKAHNSIAHGVAMVRGVQHALPPAQVLLIENVCQRPSNDRQRKAGNAREQDGCLVQALVQKVVQNSACKQKVTSTGKACSSLRIASYTDNSCLKGLQVLSKK